MQQYTPKEVTLKALHQVALKTKSIQAMAMACEAIRLLTENSTVFDEAVYGQHFSSKKRKGKGKQERGQN
jgi:hypothetical protein